MQLVKVKLISSFLSTDTRDISDGENVCAPITASAAALLGIQFKDYEENIKREGNRLKSTIGLSANPFIATLVCPVTELDLNVYNEMRLVAMD